MAISKIISHHNKVEIQKISKNGVIPCLKAIKRLTETAAKNSSKYKSGTKWIENYKERLSQRPRINSNYSKLLVNKIIKIRTPEYCVRLMSIDREMTYRGLVLNCRWKSKITCRISQNRVKILIVCSRNSRRVLTDNFRILRPLTMYRRDIQGGIIVIVAILKINSLIIIMQKMLRFLSKNSLRKCWLNKLDKALYARLWLLYLQ